MSRHRSLRKAIIAVQEILRTGGARTGRHLESGRFLHPSDQFQPISFSGWRIDFDGNKTNRGVPTTGQDDLLACFCSSNKVGELAFCLRHGHVDGILAAVNRGSSIGSVTAATAGVKR